MEFTYTLITGGYRIDSADGRIRIIQPYAPGEPGFRAMSAEEATAAAEAAIAELQAQAAT